VRLSVCREQTSNRFFFLVSRWNRAIFWPSVLHVAFYKTLFFDVWFKPPNAQNLLPKICTKSPVSRLVQQIDRRWLGLIGVFRGWPIQWNHAKCCGADPWCHGNEFGLFCTKSPISRLVWQIDRRCLGADPCCHGNEIWARRGDPVAYRLVLVFFCVSTLAIWS